VDVSLLLLKQVFPKKSSKKKEDYLGERRKTAYPDKDNYITGIEISIPVILFISEFKSFFFSLFMVYNRDTLTYILYEIFSQKTAGFQRNW
jgi:hypothetical protein